jgi:DNA helicase-2/ATP-dependent DNA helicase PcrA
VVVDEAQDYYPMHYEILKILFHNATFTVLGDVHQTIERNVQTSHYEDVVSILNKRKAVKLFLNKSYRASFEINTFAQKILNVKQDFVSFERYEAAPAVVYEKTERLLEQTVMRDITDYLQQGFESVAVICKTQQQAEELYHTLKEHSSIRILNEENSEIEKGSVIIPVYKAKGLEFDVALVYGVNDENYSSDMDRNLLYISCTRALHRLGLYYTGQKSPLLSDIMCIT